MFGEGCGMRKVQKKPVAWEKSTEYREAVLLKVLRAMKSYGYQDWMRAELGRLGISL